MIEMPKSLFLVPLLIAAAFGCADVEPDLPPLNLEERNEKIDEVLRAKTLLQKADASKTVSALGHPDYRVRVLAARRLEGMGQAAAIAVPYLVKALKDESPRVRVAAAIALGRIRSVDAVAPLVATLTAGDFETRLWAWKAIKIYGDQVYRTLISHLGSQSPLKSLSYKDGFGRLISIQTELKDRMASLGPVAVPVLTEALGNGDPWIRLSAAQILGAIGPAAKASIPELIYILRTGARNERVEAARSLGRIGDLHPETTQALGYAANDPDRSVAGAARKALKEIDNNKKQMEAKRKRNIRRRRRR